tara:strand:+ start:228 stop:389 length:162 start_codon:yes stop_codon:yes gene_type:complete
MEKVLEDIIMRVLDTRTDCDADTKKLIAAEILAKLIHKTTFPEELNEVKPSQD